MLFGLISTTIILGAIIGFADSRGGHSFGNPEDKSCRECSALPVSHLLDLLSGASGGKSVCLTFFLLLLPRTLVSRCTAISGGGPVCDTLPKVI
jgi:hypothetical protein